MTSAAVGECLSCRNVADLGQLLRIVDRTDQARPFLVCRPTIRPACFGIVGPAARWSIAIAARHPTTTTSPTDLELARILEQNSRAAESARNAARWRAGRA